MIRRLIDFVDWMIAQILWVVVLFILAAGAYALGFGNWIIHKLKLRPRQKKYEKAY